MNLGDILKKFILSIISIVFILFFTSCSVFEKSTKSEEPTVKSDSTAFDPALLVNELMEEARLKYMDALASQDIGFTEGAIKSYEAALTKINRLSYYPYIEDNAAYNELENSIVEDYQKYLNELDELPSGLSISAYEEWMNNAAPELAIEDSISESDDSSNARISDVIVVGDFPLEVNRYVEKYIEYFTGRGRANMELWLERSGKYFPMMAKIFAEENVPQQLIFLSMPESGLNPNARSWAKAVGMWQFMKYTGKIYDLKVDFYVDERRDPEKATRAAAKYLKDRYYSLNDWYSAIASYNCGEGRVRRSMKRAGSKNFWKYRRFLPRETRNYVPQYIAVTMIGSNPTHYGFENIRYQRSIPIKTHELHEPIDLNILAKCAGVELSMIKELNPEILQHHTPPDFNGGYKIKVPEVTYDFFVKNLENVPDDAKLQYVLHTVKSGETLSSISYKYKVKLSQLTKVNNMSTKSRIYPRQKIKIPISDFKESDIVINIDEMPAVDELTYYQENAPYELQISTNADVDKYKKLYAKSLHDSVEVIVPKDRELVNYSVKRGDNLVNIADLFNLRVSDVRNWNNLPYTSSIYVGQKLNIYVPKDKKVFYASINNMNRSQKLSVIYGNSGEEWITHKVRSGETLSHISIKYGVSVRNLKKWNNLRTSRINIGKKLHIYTGSSKSVASYNGTENQSSSTVPTGKYVTYKIRKGDTVGQIAEKHGVSSSQLRKWNNIRGNKIVAGKTLKIYGKNITSNDNSDVVEYQIKRGDTVGGIALKYHVSTSELKAWNNLNGNKIVAGETLKIYRNGKAPSKVASSKNSSSKKINYVVKKGDTIGKIAEVHKVRTSDIRKWNKISGNKIVIGQKLVIYPKSNSSNVVAAKPKSSPQNKNGNKIHMVKEGESLWLIARHYDVRVKDIMEWNNLENDKIKPGANLKILN